MARKKNMEKRNEILKSAYHMFCEKGYEEVFVREIADEVGISKALFQHYFTKKVDILETMLKELLEVSFSYVDSIITKDESIYLRLSVYANIFFKTINLQSDLYKFIVNIISNKELLKMWTNIIYQWLITIKNNEMENISEREFQIALSFSMAGGTELLLLNEALNIQVSFIVEQMVNSFMRILNNDQKDIEDVITQTHTKIDNIDFDDFNQSCKEHILWYR
jgi:Transcriptional regulator